MRDRTWLIGLAVAGILIANPAAVLGYDQYSVNKDATNCRLCHGDFRAGSYTSLVDGMNWGNLHDLHRTTMLGGDCSTCHSQAYCTNCHSTGAKQITHDNMLFDHASIIRETSQEPCAYCHQKPFCERCHTGDELKDWKQP